MRYEIIDGVLNIYENDRDIPFLRQPTWPNGDEWEPGEAEEWAQQQILALTDPTADLPGPNRENHPTPRPVIEIPE